MTEIYAFLRQDTIQPLDLNSDTIPRLSLVNIPSSSKVRLLFGVGFGLRIIDAFLSTIANQYVMISGEGGLDLGLPNVLTLPPSIHQPTFIVTITVKQFSTKVTEKRTTYIYHLLARSNVSDTTEILQVTPIPPFLVYDGFEKELNAAEVLEQVLAMNRAGDGPYMTLRI